MLCGRDIFREFNITAGKILRRKERMRYLIYLIKYRTREPKAKGKNQRKTLTAATNGTQVSKRWSLTVITNLHGIEQKPTVLSPRGPRWTAIDVALSRPSLTK